VARAASLYHYLHDPIKIMLLDLHDPAAAETASEHCGKLGRRLGGGTICPGDIHPPAGHQQKIQAALGWGGHREPYPIR